MGITLNDKGLIQGLDKLLTVIDAAQNEGLDDGADILTVVDQATTAYRGMSGATRASSFAARLGPDYGGKAQAAYGEAAALLAGFTGHEGQPHLGDSGVVLGEGQKGIILTTPTDYADALEIEGAGEKAHLGPTISSEGTSVTAAVARASKAALR